MTDRLVEEEVNGSISQPRVHRGARRIAKRAGEILNETVTSDQVYQWKFKKRIRTFDFGGNIAATDETLIEDLTNTRAP